MITRLDAIESLVGTVDGCLGDAKTVFYKQGQIPPADADIDAEVIRLQAEFDAKAYQQDRIYPQLGDQLDLIYWDKVNGTENWKEAIEAVKQAHPKPH